MSGGAAKGIAHIGVLKALEENEIPIDYITGSSMGAIVGGCYAAGMSPNQIEEVFLSDAFQRWVNGKPDVEYNYYTSRDAQPGFLQVNLSLDSTMNISFNGSLASDLSLNFALAEKLAQPSANAQNDFDKLFVPLRVVASDIFTQTQVILDKGNLSDALRASQTVPFFYKPIKIDGKYLFDGGVYNNFPVDVAQKEFAPDVIIGSNVSSKVFEEYPYDEDEKLMSKMLLYLFLDKSDPKKIPSSGVYINPGVNKYSNFDFAFAKALIDSGYNQTMRQMDEIKSKIGTRITCEVVAEKRNLFNNQNTPFIFNTIQFQGFKKNQQRYINRFFEHGKRPLSFSEVKDGYYKLVSENYFKNVYPSFLNDTLSPYFDFKLTNRPQNDFLVDVGGVIATRNISSIFLGLNYYYFNRTLINANVKVTTGSFYKSGQLRARVDFSNAGHFYLEPEATYNSWDFLQSGDIIDSNYDPVVLDRIDRKVGLSVGKPMGQRYRVLLNAHYINNIDRYSNNTVLVSTDTLDELRLSGPRFGIGISSNRLNRKQYASAGYAYNFSIDWFNVNEGYTPGNTSVNATKKINHRWFSAKASMEQYFRRGIYHIGYLVEGVMSNQPFFSNYQGTLINSPGFFPLQDSKTRFLEKFRSFYYVAGGWRNVFKLRSNFDFRLEGYLFKPFTTLVAQSDQTPTTDTEFTKIHFAGTAGFVLHSTVGPVSLSFNYYDDDQQEFSVLLHVGFLLFNKTSIE